MAIKDKSGNVYKLRGPNPLMKSQNKDWDKNKLNLLNMGWEEEISVDERNPIEKFKTDFNVLDIGDELSLKSKKSAVATATVIEPQDFVKELENSFDPDPIEKTVDEIPVLNVDDKLARILRDRGVECYCAPAIGQKIHEDDLYGTSYKTIEYGGKFLFDAIIIDQSDLQLQCWCIKPIAPNSVIYRKIKGGAERWWKVSEIEEKSGGYLILCITSDLNPDFS